MPRIKLTIEELDGKAVLTYPGNMRDFGQISVPMPTDVYGEELKGALSDTLSDAARETCGRAICGACVTFGPSTPEVLCYERICSMDS